MGNAGASPYPERPHIQTHFRVQGVRGAVHQGYADLYRYIKEKEIDILRMNKTA